MSFVQVPSPTTSSAFDLLLEKTFHIFVVRIYFSFPEGHCWDVHDFCDVCGMWIGEK